MNRAKNKCKDCNACKQLYEKGFYSYWYCNSFYCATLNKLVDGNNVCENWQKQERNYDLSSDRFDKVIKDIEWLIDNICNE